MMDKSREPENNTTHSTPRFKDRGNQKQQHEQKKKRKLHQIKQTTAASKV